ncbi:hypothetical protein CJU73_08360 [Pseudomonas fragi]|nr:hypothetical protein CJU73_08360 [Pseudomonas fragi]
MIAQLASGAPVQPAYRLDRFQTTCGSGLARDGIAGKPAPTKAAPERQLNAGLSTLPAVTVEMIAQLASGAPVQPVYGLDRFQTTCGSGLARDGIDAVQLKYRSACIAGKPAPTKPAPKGSSTQGYQPCRQ